MASSTENRWLKYCFQWNRHLLWRDAELVFELSDKFGLPSVAGHVKLSCSNGTERSNFTLSC